MSSEITRWNLQGIYREGIYRTGTYKNDNGVGKPELKFIHPDGREVVFDGGTRQIITSDQYRGTYNYVNPAPVPSSILDVRGTASYV